MLAPARIARCLLGCRRRACLIGRCACVACRFAERRFKPLSHIGKVLVTTGCGFATAAGDWRRRCGWCGRLRRPAHFQPRLRALILSLFLPLILTLILSRRLAGITATALRRRGPRGQLVSKRG